MEWTKQVSRNALSGVTGECRVYTVHALNVAESDDLGEAFVEFWRVVLTEALTYLTGRWEILLFELWTDAGMVTAVLTTKSRDYDAPPIVKVLSEWILHKYESLPSVHDDLAAFETSHEALQRQLRELLERASTTTPITDLLKDIRRIRSIPVYVTLCDFKEQVRELSI